jgi:hypothetical protein
MKQGQQRILICALFSTFCGALISMASAGAAHTKFSVASFLGESALIFVISIVAYMISKSN